MKAIVCTVTVVSLLVVCKPGVLSAQEQEHHEIDDVLYRSRLTETTKTLEMLSVHSKSYKRQYACWPDSLSELTLGLIKQPLRDGWNHVIKYTPFDSSLNYGSVLSHGADGKPGGEEQDKDVEIRFDDSDTTPEWRTDSDTNVFCKVHSTGMRLENIPIFDPKGDKWWPAQYEGIRKRDFPNANSRTEILHGAGDMYARSHKARYCSACRTAERNWNDMFTNTIKEIYERNPDKAWAVVQSVDFEKQKEARALYHTADKLYAEGKYRDALTDGYLRIVVMFPEAEHYDDALFYSGECFFHLQEMTHAQEMYKQLIQQAPKGALAEKAHSRIEEMTKGNAIEQGKAQPEN